MNLRKVRGRVSIFSSFFSLLLLPFFFSFRFSLSFQHAQAPAIRKQHENTPPEQARENDWGLLFIAFKIMEKGGEGNRPRRSNCFLLFFIYSLQALHVARCDARQGGNIQHIQHLGSASRSNASASLFHDRAKGARKGEGRGQKDGL